VTPIACGSNDTLSRVSTLSVSVPPYCGVPNDSHQAPVEDLVVVSETLDVVAVVISKVVVLELVDVCVVCFEVVLVAVLEEVFVEVHAETREAAIKTVINEMNNIFLTTNNLPYNQFNELLKTNNIKFPNNPPYIKCTQIKCKNR